MKKSSSRIDEDGRECTVCGIFKEWSAFNVFKTGIRGRFSKCRECYNESRRVSYSRRKTAQNIIRDDIDYSLRLADGVANFYKRMMT